MQPATTIPPPGKILVIDDNTIIQRTVQLALKDLGYQVLLAGEIADALRIVRAEKPVLILLDINFPLDPSVFSGGLRDGFWALEWMRHMDEVKGTPVIVISGDDPATARPRALAAGAAAYLHKPISKDELAATVAGLLAK
jgi:CheY-like chemotaxis protein